MKYQGVCIAVNNVRLAREFYEDLFALEVFQDYGLCIAFKGGLSLQQNFDWLLGISKETIIKKSHNMELYFEEDDFDEFLNKLRYRSDIKYLGDGVRNKAGVNVQYGSMTWMDISLRLVKT